MGYDPTMAGMDGMDGTEYAGYNLEGADNTVPPDGDGKATRQRLLLKLINLLTMWPILGTRFPLSGS